MTSKWTLAGLLLLCAGAARAQPGLRAGTGFATLSTLNFDGAYREAHTTGKLAYHLGVFYERPLAGRWTLLPEVQYSFQQLDLQVEDNSMQDSGYRGQYRLQLGYVSVPVFARAAFGKWYLEAGAQLAILVHAHEQGTEEISGFMTSTTAAVDRAAADRYLRADIGLGVGAGLKLPAGFGLGLRATTGLLSLTQENSASDNYGGSLRNQVVQLGLSYQLKQPTATSPQ